LSDEEFVIAIYNKFLGREPDQDSYEHYLGLIKSGIVRQAVIEAIKDSGSFLNYQAKKKGKI
jgi:hypothetical protein